VGSPLLAWRPLALLVTDGGPGGDLGGLPPGGSGFRKLGPRDMGSPIGSPGGNDSIEVPGTPWEEVIGVAITMPEGLDFPKSPAPSIVLDNSGSV
jgi:hypothetical protein